MTPHTLPQLNLPPLEAPRIERCDDGIVRIFDPLRGKPVALTPEEWVRQHFTAWMIGSLSYPQALLANEVSLKLNDMSRRSDTVLFFPDGRTPRMIVEYKAPHIEITQRVFDQIARYNMVLKAPWLAVSNGMRHFCCHIDHYTHRVTFLREFPPYPSL